MLTFMRESSSESATLVIAGEVAKCLRPRDVIALDGALGAGKTCFVRGLVAGLGGDPRQVSSPTFVLHQAYEVGGLPSPSGRGVGLRRAQSSRGEGSRSEISRIAHIDAYRMTGAHDLESIGWDELLEADDLIIAIEWPTKIPQDSLPRLRTIRIQFEVAGESMRRLSFAIPSAITGRFTSLDREIRGCRTCGRKITADGSTELAEVNPFVPFCSERCKLADLGAWFSEKHSITRPLEQRDIEEG